MRRPYNFLVGIVMMMLLTSVWAQQTRVTPNLIRYDTFDQPLISPIRWFSQWQCGSPTVMECQRQIQNGRLNLRVRDYGDRTDNQGIQYGVSKLYLTSAAVTDIAADVIVRRTVAQNCRDNPNGAHGQALLVGTFFNGGGGTSDDLTAFLQFDRYPSDPTNAVHVGGFLGYQNQFFDNVDLGYIYVGEPVRAELKWDQPNHRFIARLFRPLLGRTIEVFMPYAVADTTSAVFSYKGLSANAFAPNCTDGVSFAEMDVTFDNVRTNVAPPH